MYSGCVRFRHSANHHQSPIRQSGALERPCLTLNLKACGSLKYNHYHVLSSFFPLPMPFQQKTVKYLTSSDGTTIYADAVGNTEGPNMIFVHGHSLSAAVFDDIFKAEKYSQNFFFVRLLLLSRFLNLKLPAPERFGTT